MSDPRDVDRDGPPAGEIPPGGRPRRSDVVGDIAEMLERQLLIYSAHRLASLAERLNIPLNDLKALEIVSAFETVSTGQLAQLLGVSSGGATALINRLEASGHIIRGRHPMDRRIIVIRPKPGSRQEFAGVPAMIAGAGVDRSAFRYDLDQLETVKAFLAQCAHLLKEETRRWMESSQPESH
jgi:DNA-binding MarR family transcriptional regulator